MKKLPFELFVSLRYLKAKRKQTFISVITFISIAGVTVGVMALIIVISVMSGFEENLRNKILGTNSHMIVLNYNGPFSDYSSVQKKVESASSEIAASTPFVFSQVMVTSEAGVSGIVLRGIEPATAGKVINIEKIMKKGKISDLLTNDASQGPPGIIIGKELAKNLRVGIGNKINIVSPSATPGPFGYIPKIKSFKVSGLFESGMYEYDSSLVYVYIKEAQNFFNLDNRVTGIELKLKDIFKAKDVGKEIEKVVGMPYFAKDWTEMNKNLFSALKLEKIAMFIILILIILVATFNIISTLIMIVMEKGKDIAILKAMGSTSKSIMKIFIIEGLIIGVTGTIIGLTLGISACLLLAKFQFISLPADIYYISKLPVKMQILDISLISFSAIFLTFIATIIPAMQAAKLIPAEALRYE